jgi:amylosucrase
MQYYSGNYKDSPARGALFSANAKTLDARISGSLASLCGLEKALLDNDENEVDTAINRILLMQAHSFFIGGIPMIFYGDEAGYTNDYSYLLDPGRIMIIVGCIARSSIGKKIKKLKKREAWRTGSLHLPKD